MSNRKLDIKIAMEIYYWKLRPVMARGSGDTSFILAPSDDFIADNQRRLPLMGQVDKNLLVPHYTGNLETALQLVKDVLWDIDAFLLPSKPEHIAMGAYTHFKGSTDNEEE